MRLLFVSLLLAACAHTPAPKVVGTPALDGTWQLVDVRCASGDLGNIGAGIAMAIHSRTQAESYELDNGNFTWKIQERKPGGVESAYCETVFTGTWTADGKSLKSSGATFVSREGHGGYKCYEPFQHPSSKESSAHDYELGGGRLLIHHKNPQAKVMTKNPYIAKGCENGSDLLYVFEKM